MDEVAAADPMMAANTSATGRLDRYSIRAGLGSRARA
jgi:hypothetical protein